MQFTLSKFVCSFIILVFIQNTESAEYTIPEPKIDALKPKGLRVSIPDDKSGIFHTEFHANLNKPIGKTDEGEIYYGSTATKDGGWYFESDHEELKPGDVLNYYVKVHKKHGDDDFDTFERHGLSFKVKELVA